MAARSERSRGSPGRGIGESSPSAIPGEPPEKSRRRNFKGRGDAGGGRSARLPLPAHAAFRFLNVLQ